MGVHLKKGPLSMKITGIDISRRDAESAVVVVDGKRVATLPVRVIDGLGLKVDGDWDVDVAARVGDAMAYERAYGVALSRLKRRALSAARLAKKLRCLGHDAEVVERVIGRLTELGVMNDRSLGEAVIVETERSGPAGESLLRDKLRRQGLEEGLIDSLVDDSDACSDRVEKAIEVAQAKIQSIGSKVDAVTLTRRVSGLLSRRGYDLETIEAALERLGMLDEGAD